MIEATSLRARLRLHASVLETFEIEWLGIPEVDSDRGREGAAGASERVVEDELLAFLLEDSSRLASTQGTGSWTVHDAVRRSASTAGFDALREGWLATTERPDSTLQRTLDQLFETRTLAIRPSEPEELQAAAQIARWFELAGGPVPAYTDVQSVVLLEAMLDPLRYVVGKYFRDRGPQLDRLSSLAPGEMVHVVGGGGIGKSALVGKAVLDEVDRGTVISYLNFDHSALDPTKPESLVAVMTRQVSWQLENADRLERLSGEAEDVIRYGDSISKTGTRTIQVSGDRWEYLLEEVVRQIGGRPLLVVLDTMEQAQRQDWQLRRLRRFMKELAGLGARVVGSGRGEIGGIELLPLTGLPMDDARDLLDDLLRDDELPGTPIELDGSRLADVAAITNGNPLCVRLAAGIIRTAKDPEGWFADLDLTTGVIEGELYRRLLSHIEDDDIKTLAYPGLVLRIVTPVLVEKVLAPACELEIGSSDEEREQRARSLFDGLAREGMLVEHLGTDRIAHRSDIRPLMLRRLEYDHEDAVREIHRRVIEHYYSEGADDPAADRETLYHQLMLAEDLDELAGTDVQLLSEISLASDEFPPKAKAWLVEQLPDLDVSLSDAELVELDIDRRRPAVERRLERLLDAQAFDEALQLLAESRGTDGRSILPSVELQILEVTGNVIEAAELAATEQERAMAAGDVVATAEYALHRARIWERMDRPQEAADHLLDLRDSVLTSDSPAVTDVLRLRVVTVLLRLARLGAAIDDHESLSTTAIALFDDIPLPILRQEPALLRDLVAELGHDAPVRVMSLALETGVISDADGEIGRLLVDLDTRVSQSRGREHGAVAEQVQLETADDGTAAWDEWLGENESSTAATQVGQILDEVDEVESTDLRDAIAAQYRRASDDAYGATF